MKFNPFFISVKNWHDTPRESTFREMVKQSYKNFQNNNSCCFLGSSRNNHSSDEATRVDIYWCVSKSNWKHQHPSLDSIIFRYGDVNQEYSSYHSPEAFAYPERFRGDIRQHNPHYDKDI